MSVFFFILFFMSSLAGCGGDDVASFFGALFLLFIIWKIPYIGPILIVAIFLHVCDKQCSEQHSTKNTTPQHSRYLNQNSKQYFTTGLNRRYPIRVTRYRIISERAAFSAKQRSENGGKVWDEDRWIKEERKRILEER